MVMMDENGVEHKSGWCYPLHRIQRMIVEDGHQIGYVPKGMTDSIREFMPIPCTCYCYMHRRREDGKYIFFGSAYITKTPPEE